MIPRNILPALEQLNAYLARTRSVGHTTTVILGSVENPERVIIVAFDKNHADNIRRSLAWADAGPEHRNVMTLSEIADGKLNGNRAALVFDNYPAINMMNQLRVELELVQSQLRDAREKLSRIHAISQ